MNRAVKLNSSQRIMFNTGATYARSILGAGLILFSSRWVLNALGKIDFGLFNVVGSLIIFITFLNSLMGSSASRHFAYSLGQGKPEEVNRWFNTAFGIHLFLAIGLVIAGWPAGEFVVANCLTIPAARLDVCIWVFRVSLVATFFSMISIPFVAMFTAKQHLAEVAMWGLLQSVLTFVLAFLLTHAPGDRLLFYSLGMALILTVIQIGQILRALYIFDECTIKRRHCFDRNRFKEIFSFAMWSMIGGLGLIFRNHGSAILINLYFGPRVNAAYGIGLQVSNQANQLSAAMMGAFSPEITASEGRGERDRMIASALRVCKIGTLMVLLFSVPLVVEMDYVLKLWLYEPPEYTSLFCQLILCTFLIDRLTSGYMLAVNAEGKIAAYQGTIGVILLLTLPLAWLFLKAGYPPTSVGVAFIITMALSTLGRVLWVNHKFDLTVSSWTHSVIMQCLIVAAGALVGAILPRFFLPESFIRLIMVFGLSCLTSLLFSWFFALNERERAVFRNNALPIVSKIFPMAMNADK